MQLTIGVTHCTLVSQFYWLAADEFRSHLHKEMFCGSVIYDSVVDISMHYLVARLVD